MSFVAHTGIALLNLAAGFYGFWLVWRVLLPVLPGPPPADDRIAPYADYFTDPFVAPIARRLHVPDRSAAALSLIVLAFLIAGLGRASSAL